MWNQSVFQLNQLPDIGQKLNTTNNKLKDIDWNMLLDDLNG